MISPSVTLQPCWSLWSIYIIPWVIGNDETTYNLKGLQLSPKLYVKDYKTLKITDKETRFKIKLNHLLFLVLISLKLYIHMHEMKTQKTPNRYELSILSFLMLFIQERICWRKWFHSKTLEPCWYYPEKTANNLKWKKERMI